MFSTLLNKTLIFVSHSFCRLLFLSIWSSLEDWSTVNFLPNDKSFVQLKAFAADNLKAAQMPEFFSDRVENNVGKGENAGYQHFLLFPQCFQKAPSTGPLRLENVW